MATRTNGFTLIETMAVVFLLAVLLLLAVPTWSRALTRSHAAAARAALLTSLMQAASHAAARGSDVVLCPSNALGCADTWDWSGGWIAFADINGNRRRDIGDSLLYRQTALNSDIRILTTRGRERLVFRPNGGNTGSNVTFTFCLGFVSQRRVEQMVLSNAGNLRSISTAPSNACVARPPQP